MVATFIPKRIHFVGIGGVGMSAIAQVFLARGHQISGSDVNDAPVLAELRRLGAVIRIGHDPANVHGVDEIVISSAIAPDNPEWVEATRLEIRVRHRSELLAELINEYQGIAVAGTHGKTTITSMIAWTLESSGISPTFLIGGELPGIGGAKLGTSPWLVAEADESDGSLIRYEPYIAILTSAEADHLENFNGRYRDLQQSYARFLRNVKPDGSIVVCIDDSAAHNLATSNTDARRIVTYGFHPDAMYRAKTLAHDRFRSTFRAFRGDDDLGEFSLSVPGKHNVQNALACIAVCDLIGADLESVRSALSHFRGAKRRFEVVANHADTMIIDDYAHHPSEIQATIRAAKDGWGARLIALFQPHRYSRTHHLLHEFAAAFDLADHVVVTDIYAPPPETPIPGVSGEKLVSLIEARLGPERVSYVPTLDQATKRVQQLLRPGDMVLTMGAGDVWKAARALAVLNGEQADDE